MRTPIFGFLVTLLLGFPTPASAHCQIPCGIYDDHARILAMQEDAATIEKAVSQIAQLAGKTDPQSQNQLIRWVVNKEQHAQYIIRTISDYFLTQRLKPSQSDYAQRLARHHQVILNAMAVKQRTDKEAVTALRASIEQISGYYPPHQH